MHRGVHVQQIPQLDCKEIENGEGEISFELGTCNIPIYCKQKGKKVQSANSLGFKYLFQF